jgi:hypothetical protein
MGMQTLPTTGTRFARFWNAGIRHQCEKLCPSTLALVAQWIEQWLPTQMLMAWSGGFFSGAASFRLSFFVAGSLILRMSPSPLSGFVTKIHS